MKRYVCCRTGGPVPHIVLFDVLERGKLGGNWFKVRISVEVPIEWPVHRMEVWQAIQEEQAS